MDQVLIHLGVLQPQQDKTFQALIGTQAVVAVVAKDLARDQQAAMVVAAQAEAHQPLSAVQVPLIQAVVAVVLLTILTQ
jgi:hypothetical protein